MQTSFYISQSPGSYTDTHVPYTLIILTCYEIKETEMNKRRN